MASGNRSPASDFGLWLTLAIITLGGPATLLSISAPCVVIAVVVTVMPLLGAAISRGQLGLWVRVAQPFVVVIAALALRALLLPPSEALSLEVLVASLMVASIAATRRRSLASRPVIAPAMQALSIVLALVGLVSFWSEHHALPSLELPCAPPPVLDDWNEVPSCGAEVSPWDLGHLGAPLAWRLLAVAGILASAAALTSASLRRRRPQTVPAMGPYRTAPKRPEAPAADDGALQEYARLVLTAATLPSFVLLAAAIVAAPVAPP
jgi:hypothetical protein